MPGQRSSMLASLERGLRVLEIIGQRGEVRLAEIATALQTSRTTAFRVITTLEDRGFVEHDRESHTYRLGHGLQLLATRAENPRIIRAAHAAMTELRELTGETINLVAVRGAQLIYEAVLEGGYTLRTLPQIGHSVAPHCSALGKAVLSGCSDAQRDLLLSREPYERFTDQTLTRRDELDAELRATALRGYALDQEESEIGLSCVAAPVPGSKDRPWGALSISGLTSRMNKWNWTDLGEHLSRLCNEISKPQPT